MPQELSETYPPAVWRVIVQPPADGPTNMAIDEAIAEAVGAGQSLPTLRFYAWNPACLSLGSFQSAADVDFVRLAAQGWDVVRRLTGGRAILHVDELTYSVAVPLDDPRVEGGVVESYRRLSEGLRLGLRELSALVEARPPDGGPPTRDPGPVCFEVPSDYELTVDGRKLLGSAQTRRGGVVLQHGALPLFGDVGRICSALIFPDETQRESAQARVRERAITLEEALGCRVSMVQAVGRLIEGFAHALNLELVEETLTPDEQTRAEELRSEKYASPDWTHRH